MSENNQQLAQQQPKPMSLKSFFEQDNVKGRFAEMLGKRAPQFITSVLQITANNSLLANADPSSVYNAAATAATLDLPLNNNLGFAYIVPFSQKYQDDQGKWQTKQVASFQLGYRGYIQLAQRSGQFKTIGAAPIYEGQLISENPLTGFEFDFTKRTGDKVIGYAAYFRLLNGFEKTWYMSIDQVTKHGKKYSQTFKNNKGLWNDDFESMALKTPLKLLLGKFAPLSIEMQRAIISDQSVVNDSETLDVTYIDNQQPKALDINKEHERIHELIQGAVDLKELERYKINLPEELIDAYEVKAQELIEASKKAK